MMNTSSMKENLRREMSEAIEELHHKMKKAVETIRKERHKPKEKE